MYFKKIIIAGGFGALLFFGGCQQTSVNPISQIDDSSNTPELSIEGVKLENPYTTEAMLRARDSLEAQGVLSKSKVPDEYFQPTHYYIRFKPQTIEEYLEINQKSNLVLWDFPLDYRFKAGLTNYRDPEIPDGKPNYLYTAVKVNQDLPSTNYEILARLILAPEAGDEALAKRAAFFDYYNIIEQEALRITGNLPESKIGLSKAMDTWRSSGNIQVSDPVLGRNVPVVSVNVRTRNWFKWWDGYTEWGSWTSILQWPQSESKCLESRNFIGAVMVLG